MNSSVEFCASAALGEVSALRTAIPSVAVIVQAVCIFGMPSTSQRHMRQAPTGAPSRGSSQKNGISTPAAGAVSTSPVPFGTCTATSSTVTVTSSGALTTSPLRTGPRDSPWDMCAADEAEGLSLGRVCSRRHRRGRMMGMRVARRDDALHRRLAVEGTVPQLHVLLELAAELAQVALHRIHGEVAECAERAPEDPVADVLEQVEVRVLAAAVLDLLQDLDEPARPL